MVSRGRTYPRYRRGGLFFGRRVNCESVPALPASAVRHVLDDPRKIPYLLVWKSPWDGTVQEAVRVAAYSEPPGPVPLDWTGWVEIRRTDGSRSLVRTIEGPMPRNGGRARFLICPSCHKLRRALYGWEPGGRFTNSAQTSRWQCRACAGLRYASEGGARVHRGRGALARLFELALGPCRSLRPEPWYPLVFASPAQAAAAGLCMLKRAEKVR